jgi:hypothetical protein
VTETKSATTSLGIEPLAHHYDVRWPMLTTLGVAVVQIATLWLFGRIWWCACGHPTPVIIDAWGPHTSQHLADYYTFSHILHGVVFFFIFNFGVLKRKPLWGLACAAALEAAWEIFENTPFVINRYRDATAAVGYSGDSIANSAADLLAAILGWCFARYFGWRWSLFLFLVLEIGCAILIRDNLTLNVVMILHPFEFIKRWQAGA